MGQRANLIIIENHDYFLYYSHWCANTITRDLFWGPEHALAFVRAQREIDESGWLDDVWAEGGAVIDCDNHLLLLFGGEDILYDVPLRRVYLEMLRRVWSPWKIRWAQEGIAEIADYVGYPRAKVLSKDKSTCADSLSPPEEKDWTDTVGSFRLNGKVLRFLPLAGEVDSYLLAGPELLSHSVYSIGMHNLPLDEWIKDRFPSGGFHVDLDTQSLSYWAAKDMPDIPNRVAAKWRGWNVTWNRDKYERQLDVAASKLRFPCRPKNYLQTKVIEMLLKEYGPSGVETILEVTENFTKEGKGVKINPLALQDDRVELDAYERKRILASALPPKRPDNNSMQQRCE